LLVGGVIAGRRDRRGHPGAGPSSRLSLLDSRWRHSIGEVSQEALRAGERLADEPGGLVILVGDGDPVREGEGGAAARRIVGQQGGLRTLGDPVSRAAAS